MKIFSFVIFFIEKTSNQQILSYFEEDISERIQELQQIFEEGTFEKQQMFLNSIIEKIVVDENKIHIEYFPPFSSQFFPNPCFLLELD